MTTINPEETAETESKPKEIIAQPGSNEFADVPQCFDDMNLRNELLRGVYAYGFEHPSIVQQRTIPAILSGRDVVVHAYSGSGKTVAFIVGAIQRVDESQMVLQALVLAPTRELAAGICKMVRDVAKYVEGVRTIRLTGGRSMRERRDECKRGAHIVVGTPGSVLRFVETGDISLQSLRTLVLDELDDMLLRGHEDQISDICGRIDQQAQMCFVWAYDAVAERFAQRYARDPVRIVVPHRIVPRTHRTEEDAEKVLPTGSHNDVHTPSLEEVQTKAETEAEEPMLDAERACNLEAQAPQDTEIDNLEDHVETRQVFKQLVLNRNTETE